MLHNTVNLIIIDMTGSPRKVLCEETNVCAVDYHFNLLLLTPTIKINFEIFPVDFPLLHLVINLPSFGTLAPTLKRRSIACYFTAKNCERAIRSEPVMVQIVFWSRFKAILPISSFESAISSHAWSEVATG